VQATRPRRPRRGADPDRPHQTPSRVAQQDQTCRWLLPCSAHPFGQGPPLRAAGAPAGPGRTRWPGQLPGRTDQVTPVRHARGRTDSRQPALADRRRWPHQARHTQPGPRRSWCQPVRLVAATAPVATACAARRASGSSVFWPVTPDAGISRVRRGVPLPDWTVLCGCPVDSTQRSTGHLADGHAGDTLLCSRAG
jgi:hypothetical protein